ncbi:MAG: FadR family transcriptional regulator [Alphaproteobacteria bacterium]|nr:FadR family transcriptional regulator [Alphaproteobacteria bacterium]
MTNQFSGNPAVPHRTQKPKNNLNTKLARNIGERILLGEFQPGGLLPNEAAWGKAFGTSRTVVREALKTLMAKGLIESRPKVGSKVLPRSQWNILDRDVLDWHHAAVDRQAFFQSTQEVRRLIEPGAAKLAAEKRNVAQLARLETAFTNMKKAKTAQESVIADVEFHEALMAAANNDLLLPFGIIIEKALGDLFDFTTHRNPQPKQAIKLHERVLLAVRAADGKAAIKAMNTLLDNTDGLLAPVSTKGK